MPSDRLPTPALVAALLSAYAGAIHLYVTPGHFREWRGYGVFFFAVGMAQLILSLLVVRRPVISTWIAGITGNLMLVGLYVLSRTSGVPVGPGHSGSRFERAGVLDLTATAVEVALIVVLVSLMPARVGSATTNVLLVAGLGLWGLRLSGMLG